MRAVVRSALTLVVLGPAAFAVTAALVAVDIAQAFRDLAASDAAGGWS